MNKPDHLSTETELIKLLQHRLAHLPQPSRALSWQALATVLKSRPEILPAVAWMEASGGEPAVLYKPSAGEQGQPQLVICDTAAESPAGRRSLCYDAAARQQRRQNRPAGSAWELAASYGLSLLKEADYLWLQGLCGPLDQKSSSWLDTDPALRARGGAIFGDYRYGRVFIYHNGADSYYASRGFRAYLAL
ncbi:MAG: DUF4256 domain-containing protein [Oscillospiraceae bacterium]|nr:DUF4256 domain-containing protein [Oscillospiraceae bacterium]MDD4368810.1 DUF4256 domain-containing protein [Oscillospiraceae bacterium]